HDATVDGVYARTGEDLRPEREPVDGFGDLQSHAGSPVIVGEVVVQWRRSQGRTSGHRDSRDLLGRYAGDPPDLRPAPNGQPGRHLLAAEPLLVEGGEDPAAAEKGHAGVVRI